MELRKDVSVGEFDPRTGLTHVTRQRGRLLFNMGARALKQQAPLSPPDAEASPHERREAPAIEMPPLTTGAFTGLSLYPEEAYYLVQRGALAVMLAGEGTQMTPTKFASIVMEQHISAAYHDVYGFLKAAKLHPRRPQRQLPRHLGQSDSEAFAVAFDVWKAIAPPPTVEEQMVDAKAASTTEADGDAGDLSDLKRPPSKPVKPTKPKKPKKRLQVVFRVLVSRFNDPPPSPAALHSAVRASQTEAPGVPVKLAVVANDRSVLLIELSA